MSKYSIEMPLTIDEESAELTYIKTIGGMYGCTIDVVESDRPSGGWPDYMITGNDERFYTFLKKLGFEDGDIEEYVVIEYEEND